MPCAGAITAPRATSLLRRLRPNGAMAVGAVQAALNARETTRRHKDTITHRAMRRVKQPMRQKWGEVRRSKAAAGGRGRSRREGLARVPAAFSLSGRGARGKLKPVGVPARWIDGHPEGSGSSQAMGSRCEGVVRRSLRGRCRPVCCCPSSGVGWCCAVLRATWRRSSGVCSDERRAPWRMPCRR